MKSILPSGLLQRYPSLEDYSARSIGRLTTERMNKRVFSLDTENMCMKSGIGGRKKPRSWCQAQVEVEGCGGMSCLFYVSSKTCVFY